MERKGEGGVEECGVYHCRYDKPGSGREWRGKNSNWLRTEEG